MIVSISNLLALASHLDDAQLRVGVRLLPQGTKVLGESGKGVRLRDVLVATVRRALLDYIAQQPEKFELVHAMISSANDSGTAPPAGGAARTAPPASSAY